MSNDLEHFASRSLVDVVHLALTISQGQASREQAEDKLAELVRGVRGNKDTNGPMGQDFDLLYESVLVWCLKETGSAFVLQQ